jgi:ATPase subunit of ABC transporter with duplicated ATPase domains
MITVQELTLTFGERTLFKDVNLRFLPGNCYGLIGANGAGKSTFLKIIEGEIEPTAGQIIIPRNQRIAVLQQDQFAYDEYKVLDTVIMGHERLYALTQERDAIYSKPDFSEADGLRAADLEIEFAELGGYESEAEAGALLEGVGISTDVHDRRMGSLEGAQKVRILLAQALFGNPDILLLDEPTNQLDLETITWLEDYLARFDNTVIVVSHDRHFLDNVCTHIADIDYAQIKLYVGNYDFWYEVSQLVALQRKNQRKKQDEKILELQAFVQRFSRNRSKARQATSRKKLIEKLSVDDLPQTSRKFPYVEFKPDRPCGRTILEIQDLAHAVDGETIIHDFNLVVNQGDKIAFVGPNDLAKTTLFEILMGHVEPDYGEFRWGTTITPAYFPKENSEFFGSGLNLIEWLGQYSDDTSETFLRGFLGRMLFSGDEALKKTNVLSGGERVRCMLSRMMLSGANALVLDEPTNHLDLEAITALNDGLIRFPEVVLFSSHDFQFVETIANRIIEITPKGVIDKAMPFEEYVNDESVQRKRDELYGIHEGIRV